MELTRKRDYENEIKIKEKQREKNNYVEENCYSNEQEKDDKIRNDKVLVFDNSIGFS